MFDRLLERLGAKLLLRLRLRLVLLLPLRGLRRTEELRERSFTHAGALSRH
jgi:hypothetical protein